MGAAAGRSGTGSGAGSGFGPGSITLVGLESVKLMCGGSSLEVTPAGVKITGLIIQEFVDLSHKVTALQIEHDAQAQIQSSEPLLLLGN